MPSALWFDPPAGSSPEVVVPVGIVDSDEPDERWRWPGLGWPFWVLISLVVLLTTGGGVALTSGRGSPPSAPAAAVAELAQGASGVVRINSTRWTQLSKGGPHQLLVSYRSRHSATPRTTLFAWNGAHKRWVSVYSGARLSSDVLVPSGSALEGSVAVSLIDSINRLSHGTYAVAETPANVALLEVWMAHEGGLWADNPLNTSLDASAYPHQFTTSGQDTGIPIYPNLSTGVTNTALTLLGNPAYGGILKVLASGTGSCIAFGSAVVESPWAGSHYGYDAGSFCPSGTTPTLTVSTPIAPRGHKHPAGSSSAPVARSQHHGTRHSGLVRHRQGAAGTAVSGEPIINADG